MATELEYAWAAGFFDGEGSIGIYQRIQYHSGKRYVGWRLTCRVAGTHRSSIERFAAIAGFGAIEKQKRLTGAGKIMWRWHASDSFVIKSLGNMIPYLVIKKDQVELAVEFRKSVGNYGGGGVPPELTARQTVMSDRMKFLKNVLN